MARIYFNSVSHAYGTGADRLNVLEDLTFGVASGEILTILGPSGCGKSTLLRCAAGLLTPMSGTIEVGGIAPSHLLSQKAVGLGFQEPILLPWRTVEENLRLPVELGASAVDEHLQDQRLERLLQITRLTDFRRYYPDQLSGGMKQRVAFARSLLFPPQILLLDEPLAGLDLLTRTNLMVELSALLAELECPTIIVTHSIDEAVFWGSTILVLSPRPAHAVRLLANTTPFPRPLEHMDTNVFHQLTSECRKLLLKNANVIRTHN